MDKADVIEISSDEEAPSPKELKKKVVHHHALCKAKSKPLLVSQDAKKQNTVRHGSINPIISSKPPLQLNSELKQKKLEEKISQLLKNKTTELLREHKGHTNGHLMSRENRQPLSSNYSLPKVTSVSSVINDPIKVSNDDKSKSIPSASVTKHKTTVIPQKECIPKVSYVTSLATQNPTHRKTVPNEIITIDDETPVEIGTGPKKVSTSLTNGSCNKVCSSTNPIVSHCISKPSNNCINGLGKNNSSFAMQCKNALQNPKNTNIKSSIESKEHSSKTGCRQQQSSKPVDSTKSTTVNGSNTSPNVIPNFLHEEKSVVDSGKSLEGANTCSPKLISTSHQSAKEAATSSVSTGSVDNLSNTSSKLPSNSSTSITASTVSKAAPPPQGTDASGKKVEGNSLKVKTHIDILWHKVQYCMYTYLL